MNVKYLKSKQVMFLVCKAKNEKWNYQIVIRNFRIIGLNTEKRENESD
jgi:hypothetical protein